MRLYASSAGMGTMDGCSVGAHTNTTSFAGGIDKGLKLNINCAHICAWHILELSTKPIYVTAII